MKLKSMIGADFSQRTSIGLYALFYAIAFAFSSPGLTAATLLPGGIDSAKVDSLRRVVQGSTGKEKLDAMLELVYEFADNDNARALSIAKDASELAVALGDTLELAMTTRIQGQLLRRIGNNKDGIKRLRTALSIAERNNLTDEQILSSNSLALAYVFAARYDSALRLYFSALRIPVVKNREKWHAVILGGIGLLYYKLGEKDESILFSSKAIDAAESLKEDDIVMTSLSNITLCSIMLGNYDAAEKELAEWTNRFADKAEDRQLMHWEFNQGMMLMKTPRYRSAIEYFDRSLRRATEIGEGFLEIESNACIARCLAGLGNYQEANRLLARCEERAIGSGLDASLLLVYEAMLAMHGKGQSQAQIINTQAKYINVKERVLNENVVHRISVARVEFEEEENHKLIAKQTESLALSREVIVRQRWLNIVSVTLAIVLIGFVALLYRFVRYQRSIAKDLDRKVVERTLELQSNQDVLVRSLHEQHMLMELVSRKVHASMATFRGLWYVKEMEALDHHATDKGFESAARELLQISKIIDRSSELRAAPEMTRCQTALCGPTGGRTQGTSDRFNKNENM